MFSHNSIWTDEELENLAAQLAEYDLEPEDLLRFEDNIQRTGPRVLTRTGELLTPTPYRPIRPPRTRGSRRLREIVREFEPQRSEAGDPGDLLDVDLTSDVEREGVERGRRYIKWTIIKNLDEDQTDNIMEKFALNAGTAFYIRYVYSKTLYNTKTKETMVFYTNKPGSPWMRTLEDARKWIQKQENSRLEGDSDAPASDWDEVDFFNLTVKIVLDNQTPLLGGGLLPDWLRKLAHGREMYTLDTFNDNFCLWRCLAVFQGARADRCERAARDLAKKFFCGSPFNFKVPLKDVPKTPLRELERVERCLNKGKPIAEWLGIRVYEPQRQEDGQVTWVLVRRAPEKLQNVMTIGYYNEHAFLIKDIARLARIIECKDCHQRFTQACHLHRHAQTCSQGKTAIWCPHEKVQAPTTAYERAFFPKSTASKSSLRWLEREGQQRGRHIHHAMCGHGGERWILGGPVDGYDPGLKTVYQYHGCVWHGCVKCFPQNREITIEDVSMEERYQKTKERTAQLRQAGFFVYEVWACEAGQIRGDEPQPLTRSYPHAILFDFEAYCDNVKRERPTPLLSIENEHVPISVSIGDTLEREPTHICDRDPAELVKRFIAELERRGKVLREKTREEFAPEDMELLPKKQRVLINEWCNQVPVLGFNSGKYDFNVIKKHFVGEIAGTAPKITIAKNGNKTMFMHTEDFRFLDIINYLGPATSYEKWVKAYGGEGEKSWFPYEWFDSPEKLDHPGLPPYQEWFSALKRSFTLTLDEYARCERRFKEEGMQTFADWLKDYNNQDVGPGLEALQRMRSFYTEKGIDILKDAVSLPGVSMQYLLRGAVERGAELYTPGKQEYEMLKGAVVGGPSLVFTRYHEVGRSMIRDHRVKEPRLCQKIQGYDANALYLSTMLRDMPCGKGRVIDREEYPITPQTLMRRQEEGSWFGFAEVDIEIPKELWPKFEEMCPFCTKKVPEEAVPEHMQEYLASTGRKKGEGKKLVGALAAEKILLYAPLLRWYVDHGAVIKKVHRTIDYKPGKIFTWFVEQVTEARREGDQDKSKALLAEVFKLLGNSAYGKMIEAVERQKNTIYTKDEKTVDRALRSAYFEDLEEIGAAYELESRKVKVVIRRPFQVGIAVYQLTKLRMLEFYYDFLDKFIAREDFELIQMDTDSNYIAFSGSSLEAVVRPELKEEFEAEKRQWLSWDKWSGRTPGLFKLEGEGSRMIAFCSKCYFIDDGNGEKKKLSTKGMLKKQNELNWERFKAALEGERDLATNRGFRMRDGKMVTYEKQKLGLSAYYDKRWVLPDGIHTEPIEFHLS